MSGTARMALIVTMDMECERDDNSERFEKLESGEGQPKSVEDHFEFDISKQEDKIVEGENDDRGNDEQETGDEDSDKEENVEEPNDGCHDNEHILNEQDQCDMEIEVNAVDLRIVETKYKPVDKKVRPLNISLPVKYGITPFFHPEMTRDGLHSYWDAD